MSKISKIELIILKALWVETHLSARAMHEYCLKDLEWSFSSTRTTLQRMVDKSLLETDKSDGPMVYRAKNAKVTTLALMMKDFMQGVLELEGPLPTSAFHDSRILSKDELAELEEILKEPES